MRDEKFLIGWLQGAIAATRSTIQDDGAVPTLDLMSATIDELADLLFVETVTIQSVEHSEPEGEADGESMSDFVTDAPPAPRIYKLHNRNTSVTEEELRVVWEWYKGRHHARSIDGVRVSTMFPLSGFTDREQREVVRLALSVFGAV